MSIDGKDLEIREMHLSRHDTLDKLFDYCEIATPERQFFEILGCNNLEDLNNPQLFDNYVNMIYFLIHYTFEIDNHAAMADIERCLSLAALAHYHNFSELLNENARNANDSHMEELIKRIRNEVNSLPFDD